MMQLLPRAKGIGDTSPVPSKSTKTKQKKTIAKGPIFTQQSGNAVVSDGIEVNCQKAIEGGQI